MKKLIPVILLSHLLGFAVQAEPLKIHVISGAKEYQSEASLKTFMPWLAKNYDVSYTASWGVDGIKELPELNHLEEADLLLVFARRMKLGEQQMQRIRGHWESGKAVIGLRTASHAFQKEDNEIFDKQVMGNNYAGHFGDETVKVSAHPDASEHPILKGVGKIVSTKLYKAGPLAAEAVVLQYGDNGKGKEVVSLVHTYKGGRVFYTSLGVPKDFELPAFKQLLANAVAWTTRRDDLARKE